MFAPNPKSQIPNKSKSYLQYPTMQAQFVCHQPQCLQHNSQTLLVHTPRKGTVKLEKSGISTSIQCESEKTTKSPQNFERIKINNKISTRSIGLWQSDSHLWKLIFGEYNQQACLAARAIAHYNKLSANRRTRHCACWKKKRWK